MSLIPRSCPFCGTQPDIVNTRSDTNGKMAVVISCPNFVGCLAPRAVEFQGADEADTIDATERIVTKWNHRTIAAELAEYKRPELGALIQATTLLRSHFTVCYKLDKNDRRVVALDRLGMKLTHTILNTGCSMGELAVLTGTDIHWDAVAKEFCL